MVLGPAAPPGEAERPPRKLDVSVRGRVLAPSDRMRYNPGSLVLIACADRSCASASSARVIDEQSSILSAEKVRTLLRGKVPDADLEAKAAQLLDAAITKRLAAGESVTVPLETMEAAERERFVRLAAAHRRPRHLVLVEVAKDAVAGGGREPLGELRPRSTRATRPGGLHDLAAPRRPSGRRAQEDRLLAAAVRRLSAPLRRLHASHMYFTVIHVSSPGSQRSSE